MRKEQRLLKNLYYRLVDVENALKTFFFCNVDKFNRFYISEIMEEDLFNIISEYVTYYERNKLYFNNNVQKKLNKLHDGI